jgi:predicted nucleic acid-binding protein
VTVFVDTSALYAVLDRDDANHAAAAATFSSLLASATLVSHSYVAVETSALVQRRLGADALRTLHDDVLPVLEVAYVDESLHRSAVAAHLASGARHVSLVDWTSFELMRRRELAEAFAFDEDFLQQGFVVLPSQADVRDP